MKIRKKQINKKKEVEKKERKQKEGRKEMHVMMFNARYCSRIKKYIA